MELSRRNLLSLASLSLGAGILSGCAKHHPRSYQQKPSAAKTKLSWWHQDYPTSDLNQQLAKWAATSGLEIEINTPKDYQKAITAILATPDRPNVFELPIPNLIQHIKAKDIVDLADIFTSESNDYLDFSYRSFSESQAVYGIPVALDAQFFAYRKSLFDKAGITPPKNFKELVAIANELQSQKVLGLYAGGQDSIPVFANALVWSSGSELLAEGKPAFNKPEVIETLKSFKEAKVFYSKNELSGDTPEHLISGKVAIQWLGSWDLPKLQEALKEDLGILPFFGVSGEKVIPVAIHGIAAGNNEVKLSDSKKFIQELWIKDIAKQESFCNDFGFRIPVRKSLIDKLKGTAKELAELAVSHGKTAPIAWRDTMQQDLTFAITEIVFKDVNPEKSLTLATEKITKKLEN